MASKHTTACAHEWQRWDYFTDKCVDCALVVDARYDRVYVSDRRD